jgi:hypothetical protein
MQPVENELQELEQWVAVLSFYAAEPLQAQLLPGQQSNHYYNVRIWNKSCAVLRAKTGASPCISSIGLSTTCWAFACTEA